MEIGINFKEEEIGNQLIMNQSIKNQVIKIIMKEMDEIIKDMRILVTWIRITRNFLWPICLMI